MFREAEHTNEDFYDGPFSRQDFSYSEFVNCDFHGCDFTKADFLGSQFINCDFHRSTLEGSYITGAIFKNCDFHHTSFNGAYIFCSQFDNCDLHHCSIVDTLLSTVDFKNTDFGKVTYREGHTINSPPIRIEGMDYPITVYDDGYVQFGCAFNTKEWFLSAEGRDMTLLEGLKARRFWGKNRHWLVPFLESL